MVKKFFDSSRSLLTKEVNFRKDEIRNTTYILMVDISNTSDKYRQPPASAAYISGYNATAIKSTINDSWVIFLGVVLSIDGTQATIGYKRPGTIGLRDTSKIQNTEIWDSSNNFLSYAVESGEFKDCITNFKETTTSVNTNNSLEDAGGDQIIPGVGDLILKIKKVDGIGTILVHYFAWYLVEEL